ncbi:hypothetical protein S83_016151 [Arachis hypogaea]
MKEKKSEKGSTGRRREEERRGEGRKETTTPHMAPPLSSAGERELEGERKRDGGEKKGCLVAAETPPPLLGLLPPLSSPQDSDSLLLLHQFLVPRYHLLSPRFSDPHSISHHLVLLAIISWSKPPMTLPTYPVMILFDLSRGSNPTLKFNGFMRIELHCSPLMDWCRLEAPSPLAMLALQM